MIFVSANIKGGPGKSMVAQTTAVGFVLRGADVLLVDADPQETSYEWAMARSAHMEGRDNGAPMRCVKASGDIARQLLDLAARYSHVIVDVGAGDSQALRSALAVADYVLLPFRPKRRDLKTLGRVQELISITRAVNPNAKIRALLNQASTRFGGIERVNVARDTIRAWEVETLDAFLFDRQVYDDADEDGLSVWELDDSKAIAEASAVYSELFGGEQWPV